MRQFLIATHGNFAQGIMDSVTLISGGHDNVKCYCAYANGQEDLDANIRSLLESYDKDDEIIVVTDILGGSVCCAFLRQTTRPNLHVLAGLSLPLLLELFTGEERPLEEMLETAMQYARESVCYCNMVMKQQMQDDSF